jgi:hypothetical protein
MLRGPFPWQRQHREKGYFGNAHLDFMANSLFWG